MTHDPLLTTVAPVSEIRTTATRLEQFESTMPEAGIPTAAAVPVAKYLSDRFHTLVLQPTTSCNLDCAYCYLPDRKANRLMPTQVADACARSIEAQGAPQPVDVVWHGGEPTATPIGHMRSLLEPFESLRNAGMVRHGIQTNATLINARWCDLFDQFDFEVGISVDGPAATNRHRVDWRGQPTWARTMRGLHTLQEHGIGFTAICVVSPEVIDQADALIDFFGGLGCISVGFNLEEQEGTSRPPLQDAAAYRFWRRLWRHRAAGSLLPVRDLDRLASYVAATRAGHHRHYRHDPIPTVAWDGRTVLLSPELLGINSTVYEDFLAGNVLNTTIGAMIAAAPALRYVREFATGLDMCARTCPLWDFCGGGQAGNRFFEIGNFTVSETHYCRTTRKALVRAAADHLRLRREVNDERRPQHRARR